MLAAGFMLMAASAGSVISGSAHVVDGDTLRVAGVRIRLSGIDAPEVAQRCGRVARSTACGVESAAWLRARVEGRIVTCTAVDRDRYARIVAVCRDQAGDIGEALVRAGWATAYRRYSQAYVEDEHSARMARRGIWADAFQQPSSYRSDRRETSGTPPPDARCPIKGNVNSKGNRIFHVPGGRDYASVRIDVDRGERWFCTEAQAVGAGWQRAG